MKQMKTTAIIYSYNSKNSGKVAEKIMKAFGSGELEAFNAEDLTEEQFLAFDRLILSSPTWFDGELASYWDEFVPALENMDLSGKKIALFGMGDQWGYPENFGDAVGLLAGILQSRGAQIIGHTSTEGYTFEKSKALNDGKFAGLLLDEENQGQLTDERVNKWVSALKVEFN
jgi:flavodoxin I